MTKAALLLPLILLAFNAASCGRPVNAASVSSDDEMCELAKDAVSAEGLYDKTIMAGCDGGVSEEMSDYYILRLNSHCQEDVCGSVLLGWYAVEKDTGRVFVWNVADWSLGDEVTTSN
jgi:hypothetical protein